MARDYLQEAKESYKDAVEYVRENYNRMREDFEFSNPANPIQWTDQAKTDRKGRPTHTLDRTNQFVQHVVNRNRENKTSIDILPADSYADVDVAKKLKGIVRYIEYASKADIAYDTAIEHSARGGLGWIRVLPRVVNPEMNEQDIFIQRIHDPLACYLEAGWTEPDGTDAKCAFIETTLTNKQFDRQFKKAKKADWDTEGWFGEDTVRICEYFKVVEKPEKRLLVQLNDAKGSVTVDEYREIIQKTGIIPQIVNEFTYNRRSIRWCTLSGAEILDETEFPSQFIGLVPVLGHELFVGGKKFMCGMVRRLMDGQRLHNYEMSALTESLMAQPKAPFLLSQRAVDGFEEEWQRLNSGSPAYLLYNDLDDAGQPINSPIRLAPPQFPVAYANTANMAVQEMESAVGMPKPVLGVPSNAVSGRAKMADKEAGATATFHFSDNLRIAKEHVGRIVVDMIPRVYDQPRMARILGEDGEQSFVSMNTQMDSPVQRQGHKIVAINPGIGRYDVRVKIGPSYTSLREELGLKLQELGKGNPVLAAALTPVLMKLSDMPEADRIAKVALAMLPPPVQKAYSEMDQGDLPPGVQAEMDGHRQQIEQMTQAIEQATNVIQELQKKLEEKNNSQQQELKLLMEKIQSEQQALEDAKTIATLELENLRLKAVGDAKEAGNAQRDEADASSQKQLPLQLTVPSQDQALMDLAKVNDTALMALADSVRQAQETMIQALQQNTQTVAQLQELTVDAIEDMAEAVAAPKKITLTRDSEGRATGGMSVPILDKQTESEES